MTKRGGAFLWVLLLSGALFATARAEQAQCESVHQGIQAIALKDDRKLPETPNTSPDVARKKFQQRLAPLRATIFTEGTEYSAREMLTKLWKLYGLARASGECSTEVAQLLTMVAYIEFLRGYPIEGSKFAEAALALNDLHTTELIGDALGMHNRLALAATDPEVAIKHLQAAVDLAPRDPSLDPLGRFGLRQSLGYQLHEGKHFAEARELNEKLLADAERELGMDNEALLGVLENLAQNYYELKQFDTSEAYLQRCMALATKLADREVESRMLFQLGVLAHEQGNDDEARRYMKERVEHARRNPGHSLLDAAVSSRDELEQRILEKRKTSASATGAQ